MRKVRVARAGSALRPLAATAVAVLAGCYSYTAVPVARAPVGADVRVRMTAGQGDRLRDGLPASDGVLEGELLSRTADTLLLSIPVQTGAMGASFGERLTLPADQVLELEVRRLDRLKSAGVVAVLVGIGAYVAATQIGAEKPSGESDEGPPVNATVVPLFRIRF